MNQDAENPMDESGVIVVTGASSGIGAGTALLLAEQGNVVACLSRRGTVPADASKEVRDRLVAVHCDVADEPSRVAAIDEVRAIGLPVTGLVNSAGFHVIEPSAEMSLDTLERVLVTNLIGSIRMCQHLFPDLREAAQPLIVNVGSLFSRVGVPGFLAYAASKAGLAAATRTLGVEWARYGISVVDVAPGYVETGLNEDFLKSPENRQSLASQIPVRRIGTVDEIARFISMLFRERIGFLTSETIFIDGGQGVRL